MAFEKAEKRSKKHKILLFGPEGTHKTRVALALGHRKGDPAVAVIDTEFGTDHYGDEFNFLRHQANDPDEIQAEVAKLIMYPGNIKTLIIDTFSVFYEALQNKYVELYRKREKNSAGNKGEYYVLQPRDYNPINREASSFIRLLLQSDLNIICICQMKDAYEDMKVVGQTFDGWKRLKYYFDTRLEITRDKKRKMKLFCEKDRSHKLFQSTAYAWEDDAQARKFMIDTFGTAFSEGKAAEGFIRGEDTPEEQIPVEKVVKADTENKKNPNNGKPPADSAKKKKTKETPCDPITLDTIVKYKKELGIFDKKEWNKLLEPYKVNTAKDLTADQLVNFAGVLMQMLPSTASTS